MRPSRGRFQLVEKGPASLLLAGRGRGPAAICDLAGKAQPKGGGKERFPYLLPMGGGAFLTASLRISSALRARDQSLTSSIAPWK